MMKMMKSLAGIVATAIFSLLIATGCESVPVDPAAPMFMDVTETSTFEVLENSYVVTDATLDADMQMMRGDKPGRGDDRRRDDRGSDRGSDRGPRSDSAHPHPFGRLLAALNLSDDQAVAVRSLMQAHRTCVQAALEVHRAAMDELLADAKAQRDAIKAQLEAGEITREEARAAMRELNASVREAIKASGLREQAREMMKACDDEFYAALNEILTDEQKVLLERWMARGSDRGPKRGPKRG